MRSLSSFRNCDGRSLSLLLVLAMLLHGIAADSVAADDEPSITAGVDTQADRRIEDLVTTAIDNGQLPGAVIGVSRGGRVIYLRSFGDRVVADPSEPMTTDTIFDLASLTKPLATSLAVMLLHQRGQLNVDDPVSNYFPEFAKHGKQDVTIADCLLHRSGFIPDNAIADYEGTPQQAWQNLCNLKPQQAPGTKFAYSDVGLIAMGYLVASVSGKPLDQYVLQNIHQPYGLTHTRYLPPAAWRDRIAPTERVAASDAGSPRKNIDEPTSEYLRGVVHDPRARRLGGVAGHAGLFGTADDLLMLGNALLRDLSRQPHPGRVFEAATLERMIQPVDIPRQTDQELQGAIEAGQERAGDATRGLGWDIQSPYSINRGSRLSPAAFGHGGFTGTVMWVDPRDELVFVFLSNRLHPDGVGNVNALAGQIVDVVVDIK